MSSIRPSLLSSHAPLAVVCDIESLFVDRAAGVRLALDAVARSQGCRWRSAIDGSDLRGRSLAECLAEIAGDDKADALPALAERYWSEYASRARFAAPLHRDAMAIIQRIADLGAEWHFVSTDGPEVATRLVRALGLAGQLATVYTPQTGICRRARSALVENYIKGRAQPADAHLVVSDELFEIFAAHQLGVPTLAVANGQTPTQVLEAIPLPVGVARSLDEAADWIEAQVLTRHCLTASQARLH